MYRLLLVLFAFFATFHLPWIQTLGAEYDESLFWPATVRMVYGSEQRIVPPDGVYLQNRPFPFMSAPYIGALNSYVYAIPVRLFGTDALVFRLTNLALLALFFCLAFRLAPFCVCSVFSFIGR